MYITQSWGDVFLTLIKVVKSKVSKVYSVIQLVSILVKYMVDR
jgi:hypothetical protein